MSALCSVLIVYFLIVFLFFVFMTVIISYYAKYNLFSNFTCAFKLKGKRK